MVEGTDQGPVVRLCGGLGWVDSRRVRLHRVFANHRADREGIRRTGARGGLRADDHLVDAADRGDRQWLARRRIGRKTPLMISIVWYSVCNFVAGLAPSFFLLF